MLRSTEKYLSFYAEKDAVGKAHSFSFAENIFERGVVIPARAEGAAITAVLESLNRASAFSNELQNRLQKNSVVIVLNGSRKDETSNSESIAAIKTWETDSPRNISIVIHSIGYLDDSRSHVGLARKWGSDFLLTLYAIGKLRSPWIRSLDADTLVGENYFIEPEFLVRPHQSKNITAFTYRVHHQANADPDIDRAIRDYEFFIRSTVEGLRSAGSPYAYQSIGSALAFHADSYAHVRGFPKREAGEDFYFLNKLRKLGEIFESDQMVYPSSRLSKRCPFGTGAALEKIVSLQKAGEPYLIYNPLVFQRLRDFLMALRDWAENVTPDADRIPQRLEPLTRGNTKLLNALGACLRGRRTTADRFKALMDTFDALKTLQFIHASEADFPRIDRSSVPKICMNQSPC